jgi:MFS family permease
MHPQGNGIIMGSEAVGGVIGPTLAGWVFDTLGNYRLAWFFYIGFLSVAVWLILKIRRPSEGDFSRMAGA